MKEFPLKTREKPPKSAIILHVAQIEQLQKLGLGYVAPSLGYVRDDSGNQAFGVSVHQISAECLLQADFSPIEPKFRLERDW